MRGDLGAAALVVVAFLALYGSTCHGYVDVEDSEIAWQATRSLVLHGTLALQPGEPDAARVIDAGYMVVRDAVGRVWPAYPLAQLLLPVPFVRAGQELAPFAATTPDDVLRLAFASVNVVAGALLAGVVLLLARQFGASRRGAILAAVAGGAATMLWPYAQGTFADLPFALAVAVTVLLLARGDARGSLVLLFAAGLAHAAATGLRPSGLLLLVPILLWLRRPARVLAFLPAFAAGSVALVWLDVEVFGRPLQASYLGQAAGHPALELTHSWTLSAFGLLASDGKGLFTLSPALVLALLALPRWSGAHPRSARLVLGIGATLVLAFAAWWGWHGGWCWGPRYLLPLVPLLAAGTAFWFDAAAGWRRPAAWLLVLAGLCVQVLAVAVPHRIYMAVVAQGAEDLPHYWYYWRSSPVVGHARILAHKLARDDELYTQRELFGIADDRAVDATTAAHPAISRFNRGFEHFALVRVWRKGWHGAALALAGGAALVLLLCGLQLRRALRAPPQPRPSAMRNPNSDDST
jgi:hypothetical protein